jgi:hypothetical protein
VRQLLALYVAEPGHAMASVALSLLQRMLASNSDDVRVHALDVLFNLRFVRSVVRQFFWPITIYLFIFCFVDSVQMLSIDEPLVRAVKQHNQHRRKAYAPLPADVVEERINVSDAAQEVVFDIFKVKKKHAKKSRCNCLLTTATTRN